MTTTIETGALDKALRALKLSGMLATIEARLAQARAGELGHIDFLQVLCEDEISRREFSYPVSLDGTGSVLAYAAMNFDQYTADGDYQTSFMVDANGSTLTVPALSYANASCIDGSGSAELTSDGSHLLYTLCLPNLADTGGYDNYPGVYEWQLP